MHRTIRSFALAALIAVASALPAAAQGPASDNPAFGPRDDVNDTIKDLKAAGYVILDEGMNPAIIACESGLDTLTKLGPVDSWDIQGRTWIKFRNGMTVKFTGAHKCLVVEY